MAVEPQVFKDTLAQWASGVTIVTSLDGTQRIGITVSSFSSVSLEPPRILICVGKQLYTNSLIERSGIFAVNILSAGQQELGMRFAGLIPEIEDRFAGIDCFTAVTGSPILPGVLAWLDCRVAHAYDGGDHTIFVGEVAAAEAQPPGDPLLYYNRQWRRLGAQPPSPSSP